MSKALPNENKQYDPWVEPLISPIEPANGSHPHPPELKAGSKCPECKTGTLDYDGMLNLTCVRCGYSLAGSFT
jgi:hypothetical protein